MCFLWLAVIGDLVSLTRFHWLKCFCADCRLLPYVVCVLYVCALLSLLVRITAEYITMIYNFLLLFRLKRERAKESESAPARHPAPSPRYKHTSFVKWKQSTILPKYFYSRCWASTEPVRKQKLREIAGRTDLMPQQNSHSLTNRPECLWSPGESH